MAVDRFTPNEAVILGRNIARLRKSHRLSQEELAEKLDVGLRYVQKLERGLRTPSLGLLIRIRKVFKTEWSEVLSKL